MQSQQHPVSRAPEPLPTEWVDYVFSKLQLAYGRDFLAQWPGIEIAAVKSDWSEKLAGLQNRTHAIDHALDHLPTERPVNSLRFRELCRMAPDPKNPALLPGPAVNKAVADAALAKAAASAMAPAGDVLFRQREHMRMELRGEKLSARQREFWRIALRSEILRRTGIDTAEDFSLADLRNALAVA